MSTTLIMLEPDMRSHLAAVGLATGEDFLGKQIGTVVSESASSTTRRIRVDAPPHARDYFLKVYPENGRGVSWPLRRDKASVETANCEALRRCGVGAPEVVCHGYESRLLGRGASFILTRDVGGARPLDEYVDTELNGQTSGRRKKLLLQTARMLRRMHDAEFFHIDLQWRNILVAEEGDGWRLTVIDSPRGGRRTWGIFKEHGRLRDLSSFAKQAIGRSSRAEQIRWLHAYFETSILSGLQRDLVRTIAMDRASKDNSKRA
jgi:hypothetical protein